MEHGDVRIGGREDSIEDAGTRERGSRVREDSETLGLVNVGRENVGTRGLGDVGTQGSDKGITPDSCAEFVRYNFRCSRERYYVCQQTSS